MKEGPYEGIDVFDCPVAHCLRRLVLLRPRLPGTALVALLQIPLLFASQADCRFYFVPCLSPAFVKAFFPGGYPPPRTIPRVASLWH
jgi:hypothetical protein